MRRRPRRSRQVNRSAAELYDRIRSLGGLAASYDQAIDALEAEQEDFSGSSGSSSSRLGVLTARARSERDFERRLSSLKMAVTAMMNAGNPPWMDFAIASDGTTTYDRVSRTIRALWEAADGRPIALGANNGDFIITMNQANHQSILDELIGVASEEGNVLGDGTRIFGSGVAFAKVLTLNPTIRIYNIGLGNQEYDGSFFPYLLCPWELLESIKEPLGQCQIYPGPVVTQDNYTTNCLINSIQVLLRRQGVTRAEEQWTRAKSYATHGHIPLHRVKSIAVLLEVRIQVTYLRSSSVSATVQKRKTAVLGKAGPVLSIGLIHQCRHSMGHYFPIFLVNVSSFALRRFESIVFSSWRERRPSRFIRIDGDQVIINPAWLTVRGQRSTGRWKCDRARAHCSTFTLIEILLNTPGWLIPIDASVGGDLLPWKTSTVDFSLEYSHETLTPVVRSLKDQRLEDSITDGVVNGKYRNREQARAALQRESRGASSDRPPPVVYVADLETTTMGCTQSHTAYLSCIQRMSTDGEEEHECQTFQGHDCVARTLNLLNNLHGGTENKAKVYVYYHNLDFDIRAILLSVPALRCKTPVLRGSSIISVRGEFSCCVYLSVSTSYKVSNILENNS